MHDAATLPTRSTMLRAVRERDADWDGLFFFGVSTTGVACRPSCPSRRARPEHLRFFSSLDDARDAGFRACRRCRPGAVAPTPEWLPRLMTLVHQERSERLSDAELRRLGFEPVVIRRHFHRTHGTTFHAWLRSQRIADAQRQLHEGAMLDQVIVNSKWNSHSGFRDAFKQIVGASPGQARAGEPVVAAVIDSPLGPLITGATDQGLVLLEFGELERLEQQTPALQRHFSGPIVVGTHRYLTQIASELDEYFAGKRRAFSLPLVIRGTPFEERVWNALLTIPYGSTCSYADIARQIGSPKAVRAVGSANGRNRMAIIIPCHRVVNTGGALGGYGGGLWRKKRLLEIESR